MADYHKQGKLRFWCQMVLPLVYDDSLSYMELLNKVVTYLNNCIQDVGNCETNIESLLEAFVNLQDYVNEIAEDISPLIEEKIDEMIESGELGEILADALATVVAPEYDPTESYIPLNYAIHEGTLYCCTGNTTGDWDSTKWRATTVGDELNTLMQRVFTLNAGQVSYDESATYSDDTVGKELKDLKSKINDISDFTNTKLKKWDVKTNGKIIFVGNSYAKDPNTQWAKWPDIAASTMGLGAEGGNWWNMGQAGSAMTTGEFLTQLQSWKTNNPNEVNNIGAVICVAGLNDSTANAYNNIPTAIQTLVNWVNSNLPKAKVYFGYTGFVNQAVNLWSHPSTDEYRFLAMINYMKCTEYGAIYLSGVENIIHDKNLLDVDGIHPNATGAKLLGQGVVNALLQGYAPYVGISGVIVPVIDSSLEGGTIVGAIQQFSENGIVSTNINLGLQLQNMATPPTWEGGQVYDIGTAILPFTNGFEAQDVAFAIYDSTVGTVWGGGRIAIDKLTNKIKLRVSGFMSTNQTHNVLTLANIAINSAAPVYKDLYTSP